MTPYEALRRDKRAEREAKAQYARRAGELFDMEDLERQVGYPHLARGAHRAAIIAGHAAWAEEVDPEPR